MASKVSVNFTRYVYANVPGFSFPSLLIRMPFSNISLVCCQVADARKLQVQSQPEILIKTLSQKYSICFPFGSEKIPFTLKLHLQSPSLTFMKEAGGQNDIETVLIQKLYVKTTCCRMSS